LGGLTGALAPQAAPPPAAARQADVLAQLAVAAPSRRRALLASFVRERALRALHPDAGRAIDPRTPLGELGLDSLLAVELRNTLGGRQGLSLPATLLFDQPSINALTEFLVSELFTSGVVNFTVAAPHSVPAYSRIVNSIEDHLR
jgi:acyl carrier protein